MAFSEAEHVPTGASGQWPQTVGMSGCSAGIARSKCQGICKNRMKEPKKPVVHKMNTRGTTQSSKCGTEEGAMTRRSWSWTRSRNDLKKRKNGKRGSEQIWQ